MKIEKILVTGRIYQAVEQIVTKKQLHKQFRFLAEEDVQQEDFNWADAYVSFRPTENFTFGNLKWVHSLGAGVDRFLSHGDWKQDVLLTRTVCSFGRKISEYCLSYMLRDVQKQQVYEEWQKEQHWNPIAPLSLSSQQVVIYGTGEIGQELARTLSFFGVKPIGISLSGVSKPYFTEVLPQNQAGERLRKADWIISTLPLTRETGNLFNQEWFSLLQGASFINVGRGATVEEEALLAALDNGLVRQAVLDVFAVEPLSAASRLWKHPRITITPHISAITEPEEAVQCFWETLERVEKGQSVQNKVSIEKGY